MNKIIKGGVFLLFTIIRLPQMMIRKNRISLSSRIGPNVYLRNSCIGRNTYIGRGSIINNTSIGNYCSIAPYVQIGGMDHAYWWYSTSPRLNPYCISNIKTEIGHDVWIGASAIIKQGIKIGNGSVIGAGSFVNKDIPNNSIAFGNPAKVYKMRLEESLFKKIEKSNYWNFSSSKAMKVIKSLENK